MTIYTPLKRQELKILKERLKDDYNFITSKDWFFYELGSGRIWLFTPELNDFDTSKLNVESIGLYFAFLDDKRLRLSPEAAQLVGKTATKNVFTLTDEQADEIIKGFDIETNTNLDAEYIILKTSKGILGVGKNHKSKILCQFRKNRRIRKL
ncbi:hypothetical protein COS83_01710 [archaeon CG07_land_8_20_14_0_80_38_8]|nr:MAG: hypothetical protein COS83_01710 [archaeon CG07_land_8_20_14_0_80_38_8]